MEETRELTRTELAYLVAVHGASSHGPARVPVGPSTIAQMFGVSRVSALEELRRLEAKGMGVYIRRQGLLLNVKGIRVAENHLKRHRIIESFLVRVLELEARDVCEEAARFDDRLGDRIIERMDCMAGRPRICPCGHEIPR